MYGYMRPILTNPLPYRESTPHLNMRLDKREQVILAVGITLIFISASMIALLAWLLDLSSILTIVIIPALVFMAAAITFSMITGLSDRVYVK